MLAEKIRTVHFYKIPTYNRHPNLECSSILPESLISSSPRVTHYVPSIPVLCRALLHSLLFHLAAAAVRSPRSPHTGLRTPRNYTYIFNGRPACEPPRPSRQAGPENVSRGRGLSLSVFPRCFLRADSSPSLFPCAVLPAPLFKCTRSSPFNVSFARSFHPAPRRGFRLLPRVLLSYYLYILLSF